MTYGARALRDGCGRRRGGRERARGAWASVLRGLGWTGKLRQGVGRRAQGFPAGRGQRRHPDLAAVVCAFAPGSAGSS